MDLIYLDSNATTQPAPEVVEAMLPFYREWWGNPSSVYRFGQRARQAIDEARGAVAQLVGCAEGELQFTSGGTESVNTAVRGILATRAPRRRVVTSTVEHSANRELCAQLEREGYEVVRVNVDRGGAIDLDALGAAVDADATALVSLIWANNETGVVFPVEQIGAVCHAKGVPLHVDGTQAVGKMQVDVRGAKIDAMSFAAHKFHGPKGAGGLFARRGLRIAPLVIGGPQERGRRGGTENVAGAVGMGVAATMARDALPRVMTEVAARRDRFERAVLARFPDAAVNGDPARRVANTTNLSFPRLEAEAILLLLSEKNVCASAGAACSSGSLEPSPIIRAMGVPDHLAHGAVRFSLSRYTTDAEIDAALEVLPGVIERLRAVLPIGSGV